MSVSVNDQQKPYVFVIMPFAKEFDEVYEQIKDACEKAGAIAERSDEQHFTENIVDRIRIEILRADLLIADTTKQNPNVYYEVGLAHAHEKPLVLITQDEKIPFDIMQFPHIFYKGDTQEALETSLTPVLTERVSRLLSKPGRLHQREDIKNLVQEIDQEVKNLNEVIVGLQSNLPENDPVPEYLQKVFLAFKNYHTQLHEWKELHNFLNDIVMMFDTFALEVDRCEFNDEEPNRGLLSRLWRPVSSRTSALLEWAKTIQYIDDVPFTMTDEGVKGPVWAVQMYVVQNSLEESLKSRELDLFYLFENKADFKEKVENHLYLADKGLRDTANSLYNLSQVVLGRFGNE